MKYWIDTEFIEDGHTIDLISIGIVSENEDTYYAVNWNCDFTKASDWVVQNVLLPIGLDRSSFSKNPSDPSVSASYKTTYAEAKTRGTIAHEVAVFLGCKAKTVSANKTNYFIPEDAEPPEIWGEWCSYDWVALSQLFGTMMELPNGFPMRCRDIIQWKEDHLRYFGDNWPDSLEIEGNHHALLGAKTVKVRYEFLEQMQLSLSA